ncbi:MAG: helix-turn-helix transcriptional regulator, partial [Alphaproteobacteria bacterium]|nr:helix-turn-helix transcriptional regulator [Alphaproteobacteria bacterium]
MAKLGAGKRNPPQLGGNVRRIRRQRGLSQAALATELGISASYLNLIEHNRRNLTVPLLIQLSEFFDIELTDVADNDEGRLVANLMEVLGDDLFSELDLTNTDVRDLATSNPTVARALLALYDRFRNQQDDLAALDRSAALSPDDNGSSDRLPSEQVSYLLQARKNYITELEA